MYPGISSVETKEALGVVDSNYDSSQKNEGMKNEGMKKKKVAEGSRRKEINEGRKEDERGCSLRLALHDHARQEFGCE